MASTSGQQPAPQQGEEALPEQQQQQQEQEQEQLQLQPPPEENQVGPPAQPTDDQQESTSGAGPWMAAHRQTTNRNTLQQHMHPSANVLLASVLQGGKRRVTARIAATWVTARIAAT